ncbi:hypothetical protein K9B91_002143 [Salmonella enterica subsp. enterica serovar Give]|nr:hypothetical protein [Salmonella enterica]EAM4445549.1 hypothetical protein [Salmonella enterica subsp. enterica serovar Infantis]EAP4143814.1 hypothetical protein [Salmonella enterica subsp. enterica serovar Anatum]EAW2462268.1 hypothetical protein [Salmonella enterica subsp. enterica]EBC9784908.1 hypothetical protein [Salmonella enterica subsp. enterica serovar Give]ECS7892056.1 hypothetical protein [Salmonella enterica subsp. enterica serovar Panama]EDR3141139.1 hypothetical protein [Sa
MNITPEEKSLFPHSQLLLHRAAEALTLRLQHQDPHHLGVTPRELIDMFAAGSISICYDWGHMGLIVPDIYDARMLDAKQLDHINHTDIPTIYARKYGSSEAPATMKIPHGSPDSPHDFDLNDFGWENMVVPQVEMVKAYRLLAPTHSRPLEENKPVHGIAEHHASNREQLYKIAIGVLADYPEECRGTRKEFSPAKWRDAILKHAKEYPPLMIMGVDTIEDHLAAAVNIKTRANRQKG